MRQLIMLIAGLTIVGGCQPQPVAGVPAKVGNTGFVEPDVFSQWPAVTAEPVPVGSRLWIDCMRPIETDKQQKIDKEKYGPHTGYYIQVRVNPMAVDNFRNGKPLQPGSIVVKEKHYSSRSELTAYALMIKREAGYDVNNGDWQYVFVEPGAEPKVSEGKLANCIQCHQGAKDTDYLFKFYLSDSTKKE